MQALNRRHEVSDTLSTVTVGSGALVSPPKFRFSANKQMSHELTRSWQTVKLGEAVSTQGLHDTQGTAAVPRA